MDQVENVLRIGGCDGGGNSEVGGCQAGEEDDEEAEDDVEEDVDAERANEEDEGDQSHGHVVEALRTNMAKPISTCVEEEREAFARLTIGRHEMWRQLLWSNLRHR